ncbi:hypothetical protein PM082_010141 [Marasmius tenuissimus]|nr:hypothetical protein PM082_010141 [Marasmius tenuissimus]
MPLSSTHESDSFAAAVVDLSDGSFAFQLFNYLAFLTMQGFFRAFTLICIHFDSAFRLAVFPNFMKKWLFWIYYINPAVYAW